MNGFSQIYNSLGFLVGDGRAWAWSGTGQTFVPQFVMMNRPAAFWQNGTVDTAKIDSIVQEFAEETGFTGFHFSGGGGKWFEPGMKDTRKTHENPDPQTFEVLEEFIARAHDAGAPTHIWFYGSDGYGGESGPRNRDGQVLIEHTKHTDLHDRSRPVRHMPGRRRR